MLLPPRIRAAALFVIGHREPLDGSVGLSDRQAGTAVDTLVATGGYLGQVANLTGRRDAVTAGDVAAGAGRGVAGVSL